MSKGIQKILKLMCVCLLTNCTFLFAESQDESDLIFVPITGTTMLAANGALASLAIRESLAPFEVDHMLRANGFYSLNEFEQRQQRDKWVEAINESIDAHADIARNSHSFVAYGNLQIGEYDFDRNYFPILRARFRGEHMANAIRDRTKSSDTNWQENASRFGTTTGFQHFWPRMRNSGQWVQFSFDWSPSNVNISMQDADEGSKWLEAMDRRPQFAMLSTLTIREEPSEDTNVLVYDFSVQCIVIYRYANNVFHSSVLTTPKGSGQYCEDFLGVTDSNGRIQTERFYEQKIRERLDYRTLGQFRLMEIKAN